MPQARKKVPPKPLFSGSAHLKQWQRCYEEWLTSVRELSGSLQTFRSYRSETTLFFTDPKRSPDNYSREEVATFVRRPSYHAGGQHMTPAPCTQNRRLATLKSFYEFASKYDVPFRDGVRPILRKPDPTRGMNAIKPGKKPKGLTEDELRRFFAAIPRETTRDKRNFAIFSFYFWSARRREEILRLTWGDLSEVVFMEDGQTRTGHMYRFSTKGHSRDVFTAELRPEAWDALVDYLKASERWERMTADSPLFVSTRYTIGGEHRLNGNSVNRILQQYTELAGLHTNGRKISLHWLRHTRAQMQWKDDPSEKSLTKLQRLLGHENISTTMIYLAGAKEEPDDGAARIARRLGKL